MTKRFAAPFLLVALCAYAPMASATTVTVTGTNPTQNTDNTNIPATGNGSLTNARIEYGSCAAGGAFGTKAGEVSRPAGVAGASFSHTINLDPGQSCIRVMVANTYSSESAPSNVATRTVDPPTPKPPTLASTAPQVYDVRPDERTLSYVSNRLVGAAPLGSTCDEDRRTADDRYALERPTQARLFRMPMSRTLVASCAVQAT